MDSARAPAVTPAKAGVLGDGTRQGPLEFPAFAGMTLGQGAGNSPTLRETALDAIERTQWVPARSPNRIRAMVEGRPDWVISRPARKSTRLNSSHYCTSRMQSSACKKKTKIRKQINT